MKLSLEKFGNTKFTNGSHKVAWADLSGSTKAWIIGGVAADVVLKATAWHFLYHLPVEKIKGPKWLWAVVTTIVNHVGPLAFLLGGIKRGKN